MQLIQFLWNAVCLGWARSEHSVLLSVDYAFCWNVSNLTGETAVSVIMTRANNNGALVAATSNTDWAAPAAASTAVGLWPGYLTPDSGRRNKSYRLLVHRSSHVAANCERNVVIYPQLIKCAKCKICYDWLYYVTVEPCSRTTADCRLGWAVRHFPARRPDLQLSRSIDAAHAKSKDGKSITRSSVKNVVQQFSLGGGSIMVIFTVVKHFCGKGWGVWPWSEHWLKLSTRNGGGGLDVTEQSRSILYNEV